MPSSDAQVNLGGLPTVSGHDASTWDRRRRSARTPSTNPLFTQAQQGDPGAHADQRTRRNSRRCFEPFSGQAFATGIGQSQPSIGPVAILTLPDGSVLVSGGPARNQLFHFGAAGGQAGTPLATLRRADLRHGPRRRRQHLGDHRRRPALELDPQTGAILGQFGDSLTQSLAIQPGTGLIYVSSGNGIEIFNPATDTFNHFSDIRVGSLAFATRARSGPPPGRTTRRRSSSSPARRSKPKLMFTFASDVDSIAFGQPGTKLGDLLVRLAHRARRARRRHRADHGRPGHPEQVALATGGTRGDEIKTTRRRPRLHQPVAPGRRAQPVQPPHVASTNPPPQGSWPCRSARVSVTFDDDMFVGDPTDRTGSSTPPTTH